MRGIVDANVFVNRENISTAVLGTDGRNLHGFDKYVMLDTLVPVTKVYLGTINAFQGG